jgi:alkane 1-monooxygenase
MTYLKLYVTPMLTVVVAVGVLTGGPWMWSGLVIALVLMVGGDALLGSDYSTPDVRHPVLIQLPLYLSLPILAGLLTCLAWSVSSVDFLGLGSAVFRATGVDILAARATREWWHVLGGVLSTGLLVAGYGTNVAHELTHQSNRVFPRTVGRWVLAMSANADFSIEHVFGHHARVATPEDPATARRGENVYAFALRSTWYGHLSAWRIETRRLTQHGIGRWDPRNRMLSGYLMTVVWAWLFFAAAGWMGVGVFAAQAVFAKFILEVVNYMEHYGLRRRPGEPVQPHHSWNSNRRMSAVVLYSLVRHSAHHEHARVPFWKLDPYPDAPEMPVGYLTLILICLLPPVWYRMMVPRLADWDTKYAGD